MHAGIGRLVQEQQRRAGVRRSDFDANGGLPIAHPENGCAIRLDRDRGANLSLTVDQLDRLGPDNFLRASLSVGIGLRRGAQNEDAGQRSDERERF